MKLRILALFTCLFMLFALPSYGATKKVVKPKPPLEFNYFIYDPAVKYLPPLIETHIQNNSISTPELKLTVVNISKKPIIAFEFQTSFFDAFGRPVYRLGSKTRTFTGTVQRTWIAPSKDTLHGNLYTFNLVLYKLADKIPVDKYKNQVITLTRVKFNDGTYCKR